jgi:hypothetical protein
MARNSKTAPMSHDQLEANLAAQESAAQGATVEVETPAPAPVEVFVGPMPAVEAPAWVPMPNYAKTAENTLARKSVAPHSPAGAVSPASVPVLVGHANPNVRAGTARAAALAALQHSMGQPRPVVLANVLHAEMEWHKSTGRTPGNLAPTGWLRTFGAKFETVAPAAVETVAPAAVETVAPAAVEAAPAAVEA